MGHNGLIQGGSSLEDPRWLISCGSRLVIMSGYIQSVTSPFFKRYASFMLWRFFFQIIQVPEVEILD